jgi:hypothetical protein
MTSISHSVIVWLTYLCGNESWLNLGLIVVLVNKVSV